jgi:hypothetical protein
VPFICISGKSIFRQKIILAKIKSKWELVIISTPRNLFCFCQLFHVDNSCSDTMKHLEHFEREH